MKMFTMLMGFILATHLMSSSAFADNSIIKACQAKHNYNGLNETKTWSDIATCIVTEKNKLRFAEEDRIWEFVKTNPRYRFPGQSLNNCFGREKELAIHRIETDNGKTTAYYKDSLKPCKGGNSG